jgi:general secretion pathway protein F
MILTWGQAVEGYGIIVIGALIALGLAAWYAVRLPATRAALGSWLWKLPLIGERMQIYQLSRFYRTIGMLLRGGMPLVAALEAGAELLHPVLRQRLAVASRTIGEGQSISQSMDRNGLTTPVAMRMLVVRERSGNMGEMMDRIAMFHDEEISRWVDWFTRLFEPILMAFIGLVIGAIVILMYMPIFELAGSLQ